MGDNLRVLREKQGISQEKLCAELNIKVSVIIELKRIYGCSYDDFFTGLDVII